MNKIAEIEAGGKQLPGKELEEGLREFLRPVTAQLPEKRLREVVEIAVQGIVASGSPVITAIARGVEQAAGAAWAMARRVYRLVWSERISHRDLLKGLYGIAQERVAAYGVERLVVAIDPVNFEKPYTAELEGVSTVMKSTPPGPNGEKRLTSGYPAITATVVNLPEPVVTYANWFSYTVDFVSQNREIYRAIRITRALFPQHELCFIGDAGLDDQKIFRWIEGSRAQFVIRVGHHDRRVEVYNERLDRWESEKLADLAASAAWVCEIQASFTHARRTRTVTVKLAWFMIRLAPTDPPLWVLVIHDPDREREIALLTNISIHSSLDARSVYTTWRHRPQVEHTYRFDQEDGLHIEDIQVRTLERMRRVFVLVLLAALFVLFIDKTWPEPAVTWLRLLGGKLDRASDLDGPYILWNGIKAVFISVTTLSFARSHPFPRGSPTYG